MRNIILFVCTLVSASLIADEALERADELYDSDLHEQGYEFLKSVAESGGTSRDAAQIYWRLARATLEVGDIEKIAGADDSELLARFSEGEGYADLAIELDPTSHEGYYWKSANLGRGGEVRGILNSLFKARPMRSLLRSALDQYPEHPGSYYVLGIMYERVPGRPISFGNDNYAVSLGRKAIDALNAEIEAGIRDFVRLEYYTELARHLWARGWRSSKRMSEQRPKLRRFEQEDDVFVRNTYYEGSLDILDLSDREEALEIIQWVIDEFEAKPTLTNSDRADLAEARASLAEWTE